MKRWVSISKTAIFEPFEKSYYIASQNSRCFIKTKTLVIHSKMILLAGSVVVGDKMKWDLKSGDKKHQIEYNNE